MNLTKNKEKDVLENNEFVLLKFYADWCGPCKMLAPIIDSVDTELDYITVASVDVDSEQELAMKYDVMSIPTLILIKNGVEMDRKHGFAPKPEIINFIENIKST